MGDMTAGEEENLLLQEISNKLNLIEKHKSVVVHQKKNFTNNIKSLTQDDCIIISDFKENLKIGEGPEETKQIFFNKEQVSVLGFALIYWEYGLLKMDYITYLSNQLTYDSRFTGQCLTGLFQEKVKNKFKISICGLMGESTFVQRIICVFNYKSQNRLKGFLSTIFLLNIMEKIMLMVILEDCHNGSKKLKQFKKLKQWINC